MPAELQTPLAVGLHLLEAPVKALERFSGAPEEQEKDSGGAASNGKDDATENVSVIRVSM